MPEYIIVCKNTVYATNDFEKKIANMYIGLKDDILLYIIIESKYNCYQLKYLIDKTKKKHNRDILYCFEKFGVIYDLVKYDISTLDKTQFTKRELIKNDIDDNNNYEAVCFISDDLDDIV